MNRQDLVHQESDAWQWRRAEHTDVPGIVELMNTNYAVEVDDIFTVNPTRMSYHLHQAILDQIYTPSTQLVSVAVSKTTDQILAFGWLQRGKYLPYANEEMAVAEIAHTELTLPVRTRIRLIGQLFEQWILWAELNSIPVLCSTSIRSDQTGFMRLHDIYGFSRKGSFAYKRIGIKNV